MERKKLERILKSLANSRRLSIMKFLSTRDEATVGEVAEHIDLSFRATSRHLANLAASDLIERRQAGTAVFCRAAKLPQLANDIVAAF